MKIELITHSEVSQKEKNKYHILMHIYGIQKDGIVEPIYRAAVEMQTQKTDLWTQWGMERVGQIERVALKYVKQIASGSFLYDTGSSNPVLYDKLEGQDRVRGEREVQEGGDICIPMADSC